MIRVDPVTADQIRHIILASRTRGVDPVEILDRADLIDHPAKRRQWSSILVDQIVQELRNGPIGQALNAEIATGKYKTPADVRDLILGLLEHMSRQWDTGGNGKQGERG